MKSINNNMLIKIFYIFCLLPFLGIYGIKNYLNVGIYELWQIISMFALFIRVISIKKIKVDIYSLTFILFEFEIFLTTIYKTGFSFGILNITLVISFLILLIKFDFSLILSSLNKIFFCILILNSFSMLFLENTETTLYFVGGKNAFSLYFIPSIFIVVFYSFYKYESLNKSSILYIALSLIEIFLAKSGTGVVVATITFLIILFFNKIPERKYLYLGIVLFIHVILILGVNTLYDNKLWILFTDMLGKDSTLTSRAVIWNNEIKYLKNNLLFGLGRGYPIFYANSFDIKNVVYEAHNFFLEIVSNGGIFGALFYAVSFISVINKVNIHDKLQKILFFSIIVLLINGFTESISNSLLVILTLTILNYISSNNKCMNEENI